MTHSKNSEKQQEKPDFLRLYVVKVMCAILV